MYKSQYTDEFKEQILQEFRETGNVALVAIDDFLFMFTKSPLKHLRTKSLSRVLQKGSTI